VREDISLRPKLLVWLLGVMRWDEAGVEALVLDKAFTGLGVGVTATTVVTVVTVVDVGVLTVVITVVVDSVGEPGGVLSEKEVSRYEPVTDCIG
jgi:hypothetical protein